MNDKGMPFAIDMLVIDHIPMNFSIDIDGLLQQKQAELATLKNNIKLTQAQLIATSGPSTVTSDNVLNGVLGPSTPSIPGIGSGLSGISQLAA
jgi:hypothetical protein